MFNKKNILISALTLLAVFCFSQKVSAQDTSVNVSTADNFYAESVLSGNAAAMNSYQAWAAANPVTTVQNVINEVNTLSVVSSAVSTANSVISSMGGGVGSGSSGSSDTSGSDQSGSLDNSVPTGEYAGETVTMPTVTVSATYVMPTVNVTASGFGLGSNSSDIGALSGNVVAGGYNNGDNALNGNQGAGSYSYDTCSDGTLVEAGIVPCDVACLNGNGRDIYCPEGGEVSADANSPWKGECFGPQQSGPTGIGQITNQECPNGSVIPANQTCPAACPALALAPTPIPTTNNQNSNITPVKETSVTTTTVTCWDGSTVSSFNNCPAQCTDSSATNYKGYTPCVYPAVCYVGNDCGQVNSGIAQSNGSCSVSAPPDPKNYGSPCSSPANSCGITSPGTVQCDGSCSATVAPSDSLCPPKNVCDPSDGTPCTSSANSCGMTNTGTNQCDGSCNVATPPETLCPPVQTICLDPNASDFGQDQICTYSQPIPLKTYTCYDGSVVSDQSQCPSNAVINNYTGPITTSLSISSNSITLGQSIDLTSTTYSSSNLTSAAIDESTDNNNWTSGAPCGYWSAPSAVTSHTISCSFTPPSAGTYYFRARGQDTTGALSPFVSQTLSVNTDTSNNTNTEPATFTLGVSPSTITIKTIGNVSGGTSNGSLITVNPGPGFNAESVSLSVYSPDLSSASTTYSFDGSGPVMNLSQAGCPNGNYCSSATGLIGTTLIVKSTERLSNLNEYHIIITGTPSDGSASQTTTLILIPNEVNPNFKEI